MVSESVASSPLPIKFMPASDSRTEFDGDVDREFVSEVDRELEK